jgi:hypothetical protein
MVQSNAGEQLRWLSELYKLFDLAFESNYRDLGVRRFYDAKRGEQDEHVREIRRTIESDLFGDWVNGTKSMTDITRVLQALIAYLGERRTQIDEASAKNADLVKQSERARMGTCRRPRRDDRQAKASIRGSRRNVTRTLYTTNTDVRSAVRAKPYRCPRCRSDRSGQ